MRHITLTVAGAVVLGVTASQPVSAGTCGSPTGCSTGTITTFTVNAGDLSLTVPDTAALNNGAPGATVTNPAGVFGTVTVTDARGANPASWTASVSASPFDGGADVPAIPPSAVTYVPGAATTTGDGTFTPTTQTLSTTPQPVYTHTGGVGGNTASWSPALTVAIPVTATAGRTYTGTVTHSVA
ncbi:hypothetical protein [Actinoallomurus soli]|uniref:hypothetical protein n=1 Tax=Actinoallomurus soli TaxID=2952535 RepID=UPI0020925721|nr:hypothetical protein [Actinoallomurus soli]MCO5974468.1 hypothetical protein [Actinoallomurus soli]